MLHCMVDIETLDTLSTAVILSIGAVKFDPTRTPSETPTVVIMDSFRRNIRLDSSLEASRTIGASTWAWWMNQTVEAKESLFNPAPVTLSRALHEFADWYKDVPSFEKIPQAIWSHGATFDTVILDSAYRSVKQPVPWHWRGVRDTRTLFDLAFGPGGRIEIPEGYDILPAHDALGDACRQAFMVQKSYQLLDQRGRM